MKKINNYLLTAIILFLLVFSAKASVHMIMVEDYLFTPSNLSVETGDTIEWMWGSGTHTTTSTSIPPGAVAWDQQINNASTTFDYVVLAPGTYLYQCNYHVSMGMVGQFTASNPTGIPGQVFQPYLNIEENLTMNEIRLKYNFPEAQSLQLNIYNLIGNPVKSIFLGTMPSGKNEKLISLAGISKGAYLVRLDGKDISVTRKIVLQ